MKGNCRLYKYFVFLEQNDANNVLILELVVELDGNYRMKKPIGLVGL